MASKKKAKKPIVITRVFDAPQDLVWEVWSDPEMIKKWWGPKGFSAPTIKIDFRVGGKYLYCMHGEKGLPPEMAGKNFWSTGTFDEIVPFRKIVLTDSFSDEKGNFVEPAKYGMPPDFPSKMRVTITFEKYPSAIGGKTKLTIRYPEAKTDAEYEALVNSQMEVGWNSSLDKFAEVLENYK